MTDPKDPIRLLREKHLRDNPDCPYGDRPHFVPPSFGQVGFYACQPPQDLTNHTRCWPPFDHEHEDHQITMADLCGDKVRCPDCPTLDLTCVREAQHKGFHMNGLHRWDEYGDVIHA